MHRMVDYFGELRILVFVVAGVSMAVGIGYLMCMWTERRRRRKDERMYAQMYGVCPDYRYARVPLTPSLFYLRSKHGGVPLPHYMYNAPSAAYVQQPQQQVYRGSDTDTRSQHTTMRYTSRPVLPPHMSEWGVLLLHNVWSLQSATATRWRAVRTAARRMHSTMPRSSPTARTTR